MKYYLGIESLRVLSILGAFLSGTGIGYILSNRFRSKSPFYLIHMIADDIIENNNTKFTSFIDGCGSVRGYILFERRVTNENPNGVDACVNGIQKQLIRQKYNSVVQSIPKKRYLIEKPDVPPLTILKQVAGYFIAPTDYDGNWIQVK